MLTVTGWGVDPKSTKKAHWQVLVFSNHSFIIRHFHLIQKNKQKFEITLSSLGVWGEETKCEKMVSRRPGNLFEKTFKNKTTFQVGFSVSFGCVAFFVFFSLFCSSTRINWTHDRNAAQIYLLQGRAKLQILWISYDLLVYKSK